LRKPSLDSVFNRYRKEGSLHSGLRKGPKIVAMFAPGFLFAFSKMALSRESNLESSATLAAVFLSLIEAILSLPRNDVKIASKVFFYYKKPIIEIAFYIPCRVDLKLKV
jgi:hypothetical protein